MQQTSIVHAVKRTADDLTKGFIAPAASGRGDLGERQTAVVGRVQEAVAAQSRALSAAAEKILTERPAEPERFQPLSTAEAVVRYAGDFLPSWAGAISIDLMPAVLVMILCVVHGAIRRETVPLSSSSSMTAAQLITAMRLTREVEHAQEIMRNGGGTGDHHHHRPVRAEDIALAREIEENVTPLGLATARAGRKE